MRDEALRSAADHFASEGYCRVPKFLLPEEVSRFRSICDRVLALWITERGGPEAIEGSTNMAYLTDPRYHVDGRDGLTALFELYADARILALLRNVSGGEPRFRNDQYFFEPPAVSFDGVWHRDTQFDAVDDDDEKRRMAATTGVHFRVALSPDPWLEYVPRSEQRWDTPEELAIRRAGTKGPMPGSVSLPLAAGDALLFHAWGIHRGRYVAGKERRTLDIIYERGDTSCLGTPPETHFPDPSVLQELSPRARGLFGRR